MNNDNSHKLSWYKNTNVDVPEHLGGHINITNVDKEIIPYLKNKFKVKTLLDIGCGPGGMKFVCEENSIDWFGIDGDPSVMKTTDNSLLHDFTIGPANLNKQFDVVWCTEFLEHVEEKYMVNYMPLFTLAKMSIVTAAPPGTPGIHHVNCQKADYWIDKFKEYNLYYDETITKELKKASNMRKGFFKKHGLVFIKQ